MIMVRPKFLSDWGMYLNLCQMFDGGRVRRRPVSSLAEVAPCVQVEGNKIRSLAVIRSSTWSCSPLQRSPRTSLS